jgi:CRISPR-associated endonuclease/helicase Cas3
MADDPDFEEAFRALTDNGPFPWQREMYRRIVEGDPPKSCQIPTGLGKTSVMAIWLIALARNPIVVPRRLVYVVNRRTVVDQSTREAETLRANLERLPSLPAGFGPLAISTLRGQFADNREWSADPSRPAIILGTVDMIGSRLLFSGYGVGFKLKPLHAGFLGQDALLVHDEAHLEPAFQKLLCAVEHEQRSKDLRPLRVMELSATSRGTEPFTLSDADRVRPEVRKRLNAKKAIIPDPVEDEKKLPDRLAELALVYKDANCAVLVFARTVETVEKVAEKLRKVKPNGVETLTGTMRGKEREDLVETPVFHRFSPGAEPGGEAVYLVCTSAGEVGVNISADHLVCDLTTFESMAQRFGRVNRFGDREDTRIDIVHPIEFGEDKYELARARTLELLKELNGDGSPASLSQLHPDRRGAAFSPLPKIPDTSDILFDTWALTTIRDKLPGRPPVQPYLHGDAEWEPPETRVAWREEVEVVASESLRERYPPEELLADYPLKPLELLKDRSDRVFQRLASLARRDPDELAWLLEDDGTVEVYTLAELADKDRKDRLEGRTVLLPPRVGGLSGGTLTGNPDDRAEDVADRWFDEDQHQRRERIRTDDPRPPIRQGMRLVRAIDTRPDEDDMADDGETKGEGLKGRYWYWYTRPKSADDDLSQTSGKPVLWDDHTNDVTRKAGEIVKGLPLSDAEKDAVILAARFHDLGKKRIVWQRSIGNPDPEKWLAKSGERMKPIELNDYRHEFGSLVDALGHPEFHGLGDDTKDLVLHLIAVHHGFGRPHFPPKNAFDHEPKGIDVDEIAAEVPRRFARLQRKYGRWGLAYLESLLRAADYAASADPSRTEEGQS